MKTTLLSLPAEVRAQIIDIVIHHRKRSPDLTTVDRNREQLSDYNGRGWWIGSGILYQTDAAAYGTNTAPLLLTNRQLRADTIAQLALYTNKLNYEIDIIFDQDRNLLPTWTLLPVVTNQIDQLSATLRIFRSKPYTRVWWVSNGGPARLSFWLYNMLERTLQVGASGPRATTPKTQGYPVSIKRLDIDVQPTPDTAANCTLTPGCPALVTELMAQVAYSAGLTDVFYVRHPEELHGFVCGYLTALLAMSYPMREFGALLYTNVGSICVSINGAHQKVYDLGAMLVGLSEDGSRPLHHMATDESQLEPWRQKIMVDRRANGLPMAELGTV